MKSSSQLFSRILFDLLLDTRDRSDGQDLILSTHHLLTGHRKVGLSSLVPGGAAGGERRLRV